MSFSIPRTRRLLPVYYLVAAFLVAAALFLLPRPHLWGREQFSIVVSLLCWPLAHVWCGLAHAWTSGGLRRGWALTRGSTMVYGRAASGIHLQAALLVAAGEEVVFRHALLHGLLDLGLGSAVAVGLASLVFAAAHLPQHGWRLRPRHVTELLAFGALLATLTLATASIYPAVLLHAGRNYVLRCMLVSREEFQAIHGPSVPGQGSGPED